MNVLLFVCMVISQVGDRRDDDRRLSGQPPGNPALTAPNQGRPEPPPDPAPPTSAPQAQPQMPAKGAPQAVPPPPPKMAPQAQPPMPSKATPQAQPPMPSKATPQAVGQMPIAIPIAPFLRWGMACNQPAFYPPPPVVYQETYQEMSFQPGCFQMTQIQMVSHRRRGRILACLFQRQGGCE
jgi:hypothetical protein